MNYKISILIPIYNSEKVIERCLRSVFEQTMQEIEYILINDGSKDKSYEICESIINEYKHRKNDITIISNEQNQGIALVRETLVNNSHGEYLYFVDSDDWLEKDAAMRMYQKAIISNADMVGSNIFINKKESETISKFYYPQNNKECLNEFLRMNIKPVLWIFIIKRTLFTKHKIKFVRGINGVEDYIAGAKLLFYANKIEQIDEPIYHYTIGDNYYSNNSDNYFKVMGRAIVEVEKFLSEHGDITTFQEAITEKKLIFKSKFLFENLQFDDIKYRNTFPEVNHNLYKFRLFPLKHSLVMFLAEIRCHWVFLILQKFTKNE